VARFKDLGDIDPCPIPVPQFSDLVKKFLYHHQNPDAPTDDDMDISDYPPYHGRIHVFHSASSMFYAPGDSLEPTHQMIRCKPSWRKGPARYDCVFVENGSDLPGLKGLYVGQVLLLFSLISRGTQDIPCALIQWFAAVGDQPCNLTGMWMVEPEYDSDMQRAMSVIHLDSIL
jgi:hypothetical protein